MTQPTDEEQLAEIRAQGSARLEKQRAGAKAMHVLSNDLRSTHDLRASPNVAQIARLAEGIATILECMI